jgi:hypothetical protein
MVMGDQDYAPVPTRHVVILFEKPARPYREIGIVSSLGGWYASDGDNYHKMQMAAAQLGADAVIAHYDAASAQRDYWQYPKTSGIAIKYIN